MERDAYLTMLARTVTAELLDHLPVDHPDAVRSRDDLRRVNVLLGHERHLRRTLMAAPPAGRPLHLVDLGAGDGEFMLGLARSLGPPFKGTRLTLVDRLPAMRSSTVAAFGSLGWSVDTVQADVAGWLGACGGGRADVLTTNLFLHHFGDRELGDLLAGCAARARVFLACEPRRCYRGLAGASALRLIGCHPVTLHDAGASVRAGFIDGELTALWPRGPQWDLHEGRAGLFSHTFRARLRTPDQGDPT